MTTHRAMTLLHAVHHVCVRHERVDGWYAAQSAEIAVEWMDLIDLDTSPRPPETWQAVFRYVRDRLDQLSTARFAGSGEPLLTGDEVLDEDGEPLRDEGGFPAIVWRPTPQARDLFVKAGNRRARRQAMRRGRRRRP